MKQMKIVAMAMIAVIIGISFTACNDTKEDKIYLAFATVNSGSTGVTLSTDFYHTLTPTNPGSLVNNKSEYYKRVYIVYQYANKDKYEEGKTNYDVTLLNVQDIGGKQFCNKDTLSNNPLEVYLDDLYEGWNSAEGYITVNISYFYNSTTGVRVENFDMFYYDQFAGGNPVNDGKLYVAVVHNQKIENSIGSNSYPISFKLPSKSKLQELSGLEFYGNDSIDIVVGALTKSGQKELKPIRVRVY